MKRILIAAAILTLLCALLTACAGDKPEGTGTTGTGGTPSATVTEQPTEAPTQDSGETPTQPVTEAPTEPVTDPDGGLWSPEIR